MLLQNLLVSAAMQYIFRDIVILQYLALGFRDSVIITSLTQVKRTVVFCFADCGTLTTPNGNLTAESTTAFNGTAIVACFEGYEGGGAATCLSNATWDTLPLCTPVGKFKV